MTWEILRKYMLINYKCLNNGNSIYFMHDILGLFSKIWSQFIFSSADVGYMFVWIETHWVQCESMEISWRFKQ